ncbi:MAG: LysR family transcriptional regulator [bacterium]|nr:LysR family transcriptional regulator [bacterium]
MHLKTLKVFCDVVSRRSFSKAADDNGISQSGASQMVHQLEQHLDTRLIDRSKRPFVLTPEGQIYYEGCRKIVQKYFSLEEQVKALHHDVESSIRVASIYSIGLSHLDRYVQEFSNENPHSKLHLSYEHPSKVVDMVETDQAHVGLTSYPKSSRTVEAVNWRDEPMVIACSMNHPWASRSTIPFRDLDGCDFVGFNQELKIRREIDRKLQQQGVEVNITLEFDNIETLKRALEIGAGVSLVPKPTIQREVQSGLLAEVRLSDVEMTRPVGIIFRRSRPLSQAVRRFIDLLQTNRFHSLESTEPPLAAAAFHDLAAVKES